MGGWMSCITSSIRDRRRIRAMHINLDAFIAACPRLRLGIAESGCRRGRAPIPPPPPPPPPPPEKKNFAASKTWPDEQSQSPEDDVQSTMASGITPSGSKHLRSERGNPYSTSRSRQTDDRRTIPPVVIWSCEPSFHCDSRQVLDTNLMVHERLTVEGTTGTTPLCWCVYTRPPSYTRNRCFSVLFFARLGHVGDHDS